MSLTTIASPHHGSAFADYVFERIGPTSLPRIFRALRALRIKTGAFTQLTRRFMEEDFNPRTPNREGVRYLSYGASVDPPIWSAFKRSHRIVEREEGANDGLVSVESSRWGEYKGTLVNVSHLDLINWTNRLRWLVWEMTGNKRNFNAIAFYLDIGDMLAKEGL
ncbi:lipase 2 [Xanthoria parietina]